MKENELKSHPESWDKFWRGTGSADAFSAGGVSHPVIDAFWGKFFRSVTEQYSKPRLVDVATGNGAVVEAAIKAFSNNTPTVSCVDISAGAVENVERRFPGVSGVVSDAISMPFEDGGFDIVTSQFGVEYAGAEAIFEAARLVSPGGRLAMLMHIDGGKVYKECQDSLAAITAMQESGFVGLATDLFRHGFAAVRGADRSPYDAAGSKFAPAVAATEKIMEEYGVDVAGGTIVQLYEDVARIHSRLPNYDADEVLAWLERMDAELAAYSDRMSSMLATTQGQLAFESLCEQLQTNGFKLEIANELHAANEPLALAWAIIALREEG